jgi:hypothetical protein
MTFGALYPLRRSCHPLLALYTHTCGTFRGGFHVLALYHCFRGIFGGWPKTYPPCIMDFYVLGAS